jgi:hypothetical protein
MTDESRDICNPLYPHLLIMVAVIAALFFLQGN